MKSLHGGPSQALTHEYIHAVFANIAPKLPLWLAEGLAEVYSDTCKNGDIMSFGLAIASHITRLERMPPGAVGTILTASPESVYADPSKTWDFYALSWSAVHTLETEPKYSRNLADFVLATNEIGAEEALGTIYGVSTAEFVRDVKRHIKRALWEPVGGAIAWRASASYSLDVVPESDVIAVLAHARQTDNDEEESNDKTPP
jgi:hypothetical protein